MEIVYSSQGRQTMHIGARLPYEGESLEALIKSYAPVRYWQEQEAVVQDVAIGVTGQVVPPAPVPPVPPDPKVVYVAQAQRLLDNFAKERGYDGILSACTYATSATERFRVEGQRCVELRDAMWAKLYEILGQVESGARALPANFEDIATELPALTWL